MQRSWWKHRFDWFHERRRAFFQVARPAAQAIAVLQPVQTSEWARKEFSSTPARRTPADAAMRKVLDQSAQSVRSRDCAPLPRGVRAKTAVFEPAIYRPARR